MNSSVRQAVRVVIIDDETLLAKAIGAWLERDPALSVQGYAESGRGGWELCFAERPDLALVDVEMPDGNGIDLAKRLLAELPQTRVLIMTGRVDPHTAWRAGQAGVHGLVDKTIAPDLLAKVIHSLVEGGQYLSPAFRKVKEQWLAQPEAFQKLLTNRELEVLLRVTAGLSDAAISQQLEISEATVACHRKSIRRKLGAHDDRSLIAYAREWGIDSRNKS